MKKVSPENVEANPSSVNWDLPRNHRKCHGARCNSCMCITCKKPICGTCSAGISKITCVKFKGCSNPLVWST